ncbi:hypothetical protein ACP275_03G022500 [Erythranthe tilingii]
MLALSPQFCSVGWLLDECISHDHQQENMINYLSTERQDTSEYSIDLHSPNSSRTNPKINDGGGDENKTVKKLNHNASERDRRKKINNLYSSLRSLLPNEDQSKKLSIPATVSRVVKYIPEIQKEVEKLIHKKEMLTTKITSSSSSSSSSFGLKKNQIKQNRSNYTNSAVTTTRIGEREIVIQMSTKADYQKRVLLISEAVMSLEEERFLVTNATSFESFDARIFYTLHIQAQGSHQVMNAELLKEKLWPF